MWPQITQPEMLLVLFSLMAIAKGRFWSNRTRETCGRERLHRPFLPCVHREASSSIFLDFGRSQIISHTAIQIKKKGGIRWEGEHAHMNNFHSSTRLNHVPFFPFFLWSKIGKTRLDETDRLIKYVIIPRINKSTFVTRQAKMEFGIFFE